MLIDSGFGDNGAPTVGNLMNNMAAAGIDPKNIDTILVSHFHGDHISGIRAKAGAANFPNAEIMVPAVEWKYWTDAGEELKAPQVWKGGFANVKRVFDPIAKDLKQYEHGKELVPGITAVDARGHSPGHTAFLVASGNGKLLVTSDTVNHQILIRNPDWALWADMDAAMAATARKRLLDMAAADKIQIAAYHLPFPSTGFITQAGRGLRIPSGLLAARVLREPHMTQLTRRNMLAGTVATGALATSGAAFGAAPPAGKQAPSYYRSKVGRPGSHRHFRWCRGDHGPARDGAQPAARRHQGRAAGGVSADRQVLESVQSGAGEHRIEAGAARCRQRVEPRADDRTASGQSRGRRDRSEGDRPDRHLALPRRSHRRPAQRRQRARVSQCRNHGAGGRVGVLDGRRQYEPRAGRQRAQHFPTCAASSARSPTR